MDAHAEADLMFGPCNDARCPTGSALRAGSLVRLGDPVSPAVDASGTDVDGPAPR